MILDIQTLANTWVEKAQHTIQKKGYTPHLVIILVGSNSASEVYVRNKIKKCSEAGIKCTLEKFPKTVTTKKLLEATLKFNARKDVHGILVQSPLPSHIDPQIIFNAIDPVKDVDGFSSANTYALYHGKTDGLIPCTPKGVMKIIVDYFQETGNRKQETEMNDKQLTINGIEGKYVVVIGKSPIVGRPLALLLMHAGATVTVCHSKTKDLKKHTKTADIIIVAVGKKCLISANMIRRGSLIIDVGINVDNEASDVRKLCGDCDTCNIAKIADITPVPGGVGPMTIAMLITNVLLAYKLQGKQ